MASSSVSRRIESSVKALEKKDYESAFIHFFPAIDKTAKKRRARESRVGKRIKAFIFDEEAIITAVATNNIIRNIIVDGVDFPTALYKFGRCSIAHEGELDEKLQINESKKIQDTPIIEIRLNFCKIHNRQPEKNIIASQKIIYSEKFKN